MRRSHLAGSPRVRQAGEEVWQIRSVTLFSHIALFPVAVGERHQVSLHRPDLFEQSERIKRLSDFTQAASNSGGGRLAAQQSITRSLRDVVAFGDLRSGAATRPENRW